MNQVTAANANTSTVASNETAQTDASSSTDLFSGIFSAVTSEQNTKTASDDDNQDASASEKNETTSDDHASDAVASALLNQNNAQMADLNNALNPILGQYLLVNNLQNNNDEQVTDAANTETSLTVNASLINQLTSQQMMTKDTHSTQQNDTVKQMNDKSEANDLFTFAAMQMNDVTGALSDDAKTTNTLDQQQNQVNVANNQTASTTPIDNNVFKNSFIQQMTQQLSNTSNKSANDAKTTVVSLTSSDQINQLDAKQAEYANVFVQLGNFINAQTTQDSSNMPANATVNPLTTTDTNFNKSHLPDYKIELAIPSADAIMKEGMSANIKIYPPELGHVIAKLRLDNDNAKLTLVADNNRVKEIIQANLPALRENFRNADINLTSIDVQTSSSNSNNNAKEQQSEREQQLHESRLMSDRLSSNKKENSSEEISQRIINSLVDTYA